MPTTRLVVGCDLSEDAGSTGKVPTPHKRRMPSLSDLPFELQDKVLESVDNSFNLNHAKALRLNLMEERKKFVVSQEKVFESSYFGLCEH